MKIENARVIVLIICVVLVGCGCNKRQWHTLEEECVTVKEYNIHFTLRHRQDGVELGYYSPNNNPSDAPGEFTNAIVFGVSDIPEMMLQYPFPWRHQRINDTDLSWVNQQTLESAPMVYLGIENDFIVRYLAIRAWLPGSKGSKVSWLENMSKDGSKYQDKYSFVVATMNTPIQLTRVNCSTLEDSHVLLLASEYPYYLITDSGYFGHFGGMFGIFDLDNQVQGYWIVKNVQ